MILIYVTHPTEKHAERIAKALMKKRLIACANIFPIKSSYMWKGKSVTGKEYVSLLKTTKSNWKKARSEIEKLHDYETPCIMRLSSKANKIFENWVCHETEEG